MKSFLQHIVDDLDGQNPQLLKNRCFVFPSRRACVYFNNLIQKKYSEATFWSPIVLSIEEFVQQHTPELIVVEEIRLLFKLYEVYKKEDQGIVFDKFYPWGRTLLKDFDEIDRYLVDANLLYKNLQEVENIEEIFGPDEEIVKAIKGFQEVIDTSKDGKLTKEFSQTWATVGKVYQAFKSSLLKDGWAYNGLCYRELAEKLADEKLDLPFDRVIFCGFNALSSAELKIIDSLLIKNKATVYIDADSSYLDNDKEEAGYFLRKLKKHWRKNSNVIWVICDGFINKKNIDIIGVSQKTAQARAAVMEVGQTNDPAAIVLADESLLMPVLYALPEEEGNINITMGYPILGTNIGNLMMAFLGYHASYSVGSQSKIFVSIDCFKALIDQAVIKDVLPNEIFNLAHSKSQFMSTDLIGEKLLLASEACRGVLDQLFKPMTHADIVIDRLSQAILDLYLLKKDDSSAHEILEERTIYAVVAYLQNLEQIISSSGLKINLVLLEKIVKESFSKMTTPFAGEPLASRQIMGFLETRALDFENLVMLSVNEDLLPAAGSGNTYIPFAIRKAFRLPTFLEHNSIYAYHFFRLLQRANKVTLIYSTQLSVVGSGEKSRFILQLLNRFDKQEPSIVINHYLLKPQILSNQSFGKPIIYPKSGSVLHELEEHINSFTPEKPLTPTALVDYLTCSLKYYFSRILRIRRAEEPSSEIDPRDFGNLLHDILEQVYMPWIGKKIGRPDLELILKDQLNDLVDDAFKDYDRGATETSFTKHVIFHLCQWVLQNDMKDAPIKILDLESKKNPLLFSINLNNGRSIPLGGRIDRLDQIMVGGQEVTRVLDYKTGKVELKGKYYKRKELSNEDYMEAHFKDPRYKSGFQIYFYLLLQLRNYPDQLINGGIIGVKKFGQGVDYLRSEAAPLSKDLLDKFEEGLSGLLNELLDVKIPFQQTEEIERCIYCDFKTICGR